MAEIVVISEGNEISYAKPFADLFRMKINNDTFMSTKGERIDAFDNCVFFEHRPEICPFSSI